MSPNNKSLAWIEAYSMAIQGAADDRKMLVEEIHSRASRLADLAVQALEERFREWNREP